MAASRGKIPLAHGVASTNTKTSVAPSRYEELGEGDRGAESDVDKAGAAPKPGKDGRGGVSTRKPRKAGAHAAALAQIGRARRIGMTGGAAKRGNEAHLGKTLPAHNAGDLTV